MTKNNLNDFTGAIADQNRNQRNLILKELEKLDIYDFDEISRLMPLIKKRIAKGESVADAAFNALLE